MNALRSASPFPWTSLASNRGNDKVTTPAAAAGWAWTSLDRVSQSAAFGITAALVAVAMLVTVLADPRGDGPPRWVPLTIAVVLSALGFGWRTGLFIDMSRILSGKLRFERTGVDLGQIARRAVDGMQPAASSEALAMNIDLPEPSPRVLGDPRRLEQAVQSLLSNAMKFTPAGGRVSLVMRSDGRTATITVEDTGHGIPSEFLPHVFDPFEQADGSSTRRYGGLGIGLSLVRAVVAHHGGTVGAASEGLGRGSTFTISLPLASPPERIGAMSRAASRASGAGSRLAGLRVMVVDDDQDTCELLRRLLQQFGAEVRTSTSVTDALAAWEVECPDVLVSDISMPEQDGYALVRQIRRKSLESGGSVPAIALTALVRSEDQRTALDAGFQMHLRKPVEPFDLVNAIHSLATRGPAHA